MRQRSLRINVTSGLVLVMMIAALCSAVSLHICRRSPETLPVLRAPLTLTSSQVESLYMWAHFQPLIRSIGDQERLNFDHAHEVYHHVFWALIDLKRWWDSTGVGDVWADQFLSDTLSRWTPEARKYKGGREQAVAVGLLALSLYLRRPPEIEPDELQLRICYQAQPDPRCTTGPRERALRRMILIGKYSDRYLFDMLATKAQRYMDNLSLDESLPDQE